MPLEQKTPRLAKDAKESLAVISYKGWGHLADSAKFFTARYISEFYGMVSDIHEFMPRITERMANGPTYKTVSNETAWLYHHLSNLFQCRTNHRVNPPRTSFGERAFIDQMIYHGDSVGQSILKVCGPSEQARKRWPDYPFFEPQHPAEPEFQVLTPFGAELVTCIREYRTSREIYVGAQYYKARKDKILPSKEAIDLTIWPGAVCLDFEHAARSLLMLTDRLSSGQMDADEAIEHEKRLIEQVSKSQRPLMWDQGRLPLKFRTMLAVVSREIAADKRIMPERARQLLKMIVDEVSPPSGVGFGTG